MRATSLITIAIHGTLMTLMALIIQILAKHTVLYIKTIVHISQVLLLFSFLQIIRSTSSFQSGIVQVQRPRVLFTSPILIESSNVSGNGVPS